jgi:hypothetical protein
MQEAAIFFREWDYDNNVVIEYERLGDCNSCGACCMALIQFFIAGKVAAPPESPNPTAEGGSSTNAQGVWSEIQVGEKRRFFQVTNVQPDHMRCKHLLEDNRCDVHFTKPLLHKAWPMSPRQVTPFAECSYTFREVARRPIDSALVR